MTRADISMRIAGTLLLAASVGSLQAGSNYCSRTARLAHKACLAEVADDHFRARATCINLSDAAERKSCFREAAGERREARMQCAGQTRARKELCGRLGEGRYDPDLDPEAFVDPADIGETVVPNPFFPLVAGTRWVYEGTFEEEGEEISERITVTVTGRTKEIEGIPCIVVTDVVEQDGEVIEDTEDWYAQDREGNLWYLGEIARNLETFGEDEPALPELVDLEGSWKAGRDGAVPGLLMMAMPAVGDVYRQELLLGDAEDVAEVVETGGSARVPAHRCEGDCLVTLEYTPLEPGHEEHKYYAPGIGLILEVDEEGNRVELVEFQAP